MTDTRAVSGKGKGPISAASIFAITNYDAARTKHKNMQRALYNHRKRRLTGSGGVAAARAPAGNAAHVHDAPSEPAGEAPPVRLHAPHTTSISCQSNTVYHCAYIPTCR